MDKKLSAVVEKSQEIDCELWDRFEAMAWARGYSLDLLIFHLLKHDLEMWEKDMARVSVPG